jgi:caffeoyl-CoA O-methyltransferase
MDIVNAEIDRYLDAKLAVDDVFFKEMEEYGRERDFPIIGPQVGRLLYVLARTVNAHRVLELGSGFGYSAMWLANAVGPKGRVILTEGSKENAARATDYFKRAGMLDRIAILVGDALETIEQVPGVFDLVFNVVDKRQYPRTLDLIRPKLRVGGLFVSDNMLWYGSVLTKSRAADVRGVKELTQLLLAAPDFVTTLLPVRDGVAVALKVK